MAKVTSRGGSRSRSDPTQTPVRVSLEAARRVRRTLIGGYKCPPSIKFMAALPVNGAGKVLKTKLREPYWAARERQIA
jgi:acyl-CoA synthetase (AMP-forming)/AMP-acid ligase II